METSKIAAAFVKAQKEFEPASKDKTNPHFRSKYADLAVCVEAVRDALNNNGIALMQPTHDCEGGVKVETLFIHESGQTLSGGHLFVPAAKHDAQGYGSALTYARRYSLLAACGIAPEDDDGNAATASAPKKDAFDSKKAEEQLRNCPNLPLLKEKWAIIYRNAPADQRPHLQAIYTDVRDVLTQAEKEVA